MVRRSSRQVHLLAQFLVCINGAAAQDLSERGAQQAEPVSLDTIVVTGQAETAVTAMPSTTIGGEQLRLQLANTLGKTLEQQLGLRNASFGPGVGIPVIRGLTGPRIRTLLNGIGSHDAASVSPDHAVTIEPLLAEEIEILRGPATVRYGGGAIGGVVNTLDRRIPLGPPPRGVSGATELRYGSNGDEKAGVGKFDLGRDWFALHLDGFWRERSDLRIPGLAIDQAAVEQQFGLANVPSARGYVPNTDLSSDGGSVGASASGERGLIGMAFNTLSNGYGIPTGGHGLGHSHGGGRRHGEQVRVQIDQERFDFKVEWYDPIAILDKAALQIGLVDYEHAEVDQGVRSTTFHNDVMEGRFELPFRPIEEISATVGLHWIDRRFSAIGKETFVPPTGIEMVAGYFSERFKFGDFTLELGLRKEQQVTRPEERSHTIGGIVEVPLPSRLEYSPHSVSAGLEWQPLAPLQAGLSYSWSERAPDVQELLSIGPHMATRTFDVGNVALSTESSRNLDLGLSWESQELEAKINGYYNAVNSYIYLRNLDFFFDVESERFQLRCAQLDRCVPIYGYSQGDAVFIGYEAEATVPLLTTVSGALKLTLFSDTVRGRFRSGELGDVPRLPALRYGAQLRYDTDNWWAAIRLAKTEAQEKPGLNETGSPGYLMLNASLSYRWEIRDERSVLLFARADNLLNQEVRNSVSFLRNFAPEPGRSIEIGVRASF